VVRIESLLCRPQERERKQSKMDIIFTNSFDDEGVA
jgi:hypothetical protein